MNLLIDPVFRIRTNTGKTVLNLPELMAALGEDRVESLTGVQRHQTDIFHIFLCYLAGAVLARSQKDDPVQSADFWREGLRNLTGRNDDCPWSLVVEDITKPAFMQPPVVPRESFVKGYKPKASTPDALDVLQNAKNHEIKTSRAGMADPEDWVLALISLQTASGFLGQGNFGIARMNGGFGSRVCVWWQSNRRMGKRFRRDTGLLLNQRSILLQHPFKYSNGGKTLLWLDSWNGKETYSISALDPFFIEVARRIRIVDDDGSILAMGASTNCARIAAKDLHGNVGDPWTPINEEKNSALTPSKAGLTPKLLRDLIFREKIRPAPMQLPGDEKGAGWFCVSVLVRGQGTTDGFHEAAVRIPERARSVIFGRSGGYDRLAGLSQKGLGMAGDFERKVLKPALLSLMEGGPKQISFDKREVSAWVDNLSKTFTVNWQPLFWDWLWSTLDETDDIGALKPWFKSLRDLAEQTLETAILRSPARNGRGYRAINGAMGYFFGGIKKHFADFSEVRK